jgi:hypothetical protein
MILVSSLGSTVGQERAPHFDYYCGMTRTRTMICAGVYRTHVVKCTVCMEKRGARSDDRRDCCDTRAIVGRVGASVCCRWWRGNIIRGWKLLHQPQLGSIKICILRRRLEELAATFLREVSQHLASIGTSLTSHRLIISTRHSSATGPNDLCYAPS